MPKALTGKKRPWIKALAPGAAIPAAYAAVYALGLRDSVQVIMLCLVAAAALKGGFELCQRYDGEKLVRYILFIGLVMRIGYMLYTPCTVRSHDLGSLSADSSGNAAYILKVLEGGLPDGNQGQFYHPPLYYILSALVISVMRPILGLGDPAELIDCAKLVSCAFSCATLYCARALCRELRVNTPAALALIAFLPSLYLMGGRVNNDAGALFFMVLILLYGVRWYREQSIKNTVVLALSFGLGMMTKMSVALLALPTGLLMLYVLAVSLRERRALPAVKRLGLFAAISAPLGLAYPIRNLILFGQPLNYVLDVGGAAFSAQNYTAAQRFLSFPMAGLFHPVYNDVRNDYNVWRYLLKGGLFGEFRFDVASVAPGILLCLFAAVCVLMLAAAVRSARSRDRGVNYLVLTGLVVMASYIVFNLRYPYGCTMDFRYVAPVFVINAVLFGGFFRDMRDKKHGKTFCRLSAGLISAFSLVSVFMFCII